MAKSSKSKTTRARKMSSGNSPAIEDRTQYWTDGAHNPETDRRWHDHDSDRNQRRQSPYGSAWDTFGMRQSLRRENVQRDENWWDDRDRQRQIRNYYGTSNAYHETSDWDDREYSDRDPYSYRNRNEPDWNDMNSSRERNWFREDRRQRNEYRNRPFEDERGYDRERREWYENANRWDDYEGDRYNEKRGTYRRGREWHVGDNINDNEDWRYEEERGRYNRRGEWEPYNDAVFRDERRRR